MYMYPYPISYLYPAAPFSIINTNFAVKAIACA